MGIREAMKWRAFYASVRGTSHEELGLPCQDACEVWDSGDVLIAAIADGAGSGSRSELGSACCVQSVVSSLRRYFDQPPHGVDGSVDAIATSQSNLIDIVDDARREVISLAGTKNLQPSDLACTLVGVVARLPDRGYFFHVGDGAAIANVSGAASREIVSAPENGEYSNETWFVTAEDWRNHLRITPIEHPIELLAVMTDGSVPLATTAKATTLFHGFIEPITNYLDTHPGEEGNAGLRSILDSTRTSNITNDDKSIVLAFPEK